MVDVHIKILDAGSGQEPKWTAELHTGFPGSPGTELKAGGGQFFTRADLEKDMEYKGVTYKLDETNVLQKVRTQDEADPIFLVIGLRLYEFLEVTGVAETWMQLRAANPNNLRTYLQLPRSIQNWPWELLSRTDESLLPNWFFNNKQMPILRVEGQLQPDLAPNDSIVRVLLVAGQQDLTSSHKASDEFRLIRKAFHYSGLSMMIERIDPVDQPDLERKINGFRPHVLHFLGHGAKIGPEFLLLFQPPAPGTNWNWSATQIGQYFGNSLWKPRLMVLNACMSAQSDPDLSSVADALVAAGIPAVIGTQATQRVDYAQSFASVFYEALTDSSWNLAERTLDRVMSEARRTLSGRTQISRRFWAVPLLRVSAPVENILRFVERHREVTDCEILKEVFSRPGRFVDRCSLRWELLLRLAPLHRDDPKHRGIILEGGSQVGKDWLIKRAVGDFLDAGFIVRYAELPGLQSRTSLDVLQQWRGDPNGDSFLARPIAGVDFSKFDEALKEAKATETAAAAQAVFSSFKQCLQKAPEDKKILLVIGRFRQKSRPTVSAKDFRDGLLEQVLLPIQKDHPNTKGLYSLLITRYDQDSGKTDLEEYGLGRLDKFYRRTVDTFSDQQPTPPILREALWEEFTEFASGKAFDALRLFLDTLHVAKSVSPEIFGDMDSAFVSAMRNGAGGGK